MKPEVRPIELATERLRLRGWRQDDRGAFAELNADPVVMEFFPAVLTRDESDALFDRLQGQMETRGWGIWAVEDRASAEFVGAVGLAVPHHPFSFAPCVEVAWRLAPSQWGRGYATEAARASLAAGFDRLGLDEIVAFTTVLNLRSRAVMERLGMEFVEDFEHPVLPPGHPLRPHCLYRATRGRRAHRAG